MKYPLIGGREVVRDIRDGAIKELAQLYPDSRLRPWNDRDVEVIVVDGNVTLGVHAVFDAELEYPFAPVNLQQDDGIHVSVRSIFRKAGKVRRGSELDQRWVELTRSGAVDVPSVGRHEPDPDGWFAYAEPVVGSAAELEAAPVERGQHMLEYLGPLLRMRAGPD